MRHCLKLTALFFLMGLSFARAEDKPTSPWLEELTSPEISAALKNGYRTVLVLTAGTEQNGPHMPINKHHLVIAKTAPQLAKKLGGTLIAPIMDYVPEGDIENQEGHMAFAGTISLPPEVFAQNLEATARSLLSHGFTLVLFIGDSGDNQAMQQQVAEDLQDDDLPVFHIGDYYANKAQEKFLAEKGFSLQEIGGHAGLRDTSELMAAAPGAVHKDKLKPAVLAAFSQNGYYGDPTKASASLGKELLQMKIDLAAKQICAIEAAKTLLGCISR